MHVGIDLDNTIIDYERVFGLVAREMGLLPSDGRFESKAAVKSHLIAADPEETLWMRVQGQVYGRAIGAAAPYPGVAEALTMLREAGAKVSIVSHKTEYGHFDPARVHLWEAALSWLSERGFLSPAGFGIDRADVHFATTREAKIARIAEIGCHVFIDDLPEVLCHPQFPAGVERIWLATSADDRHAANPLHPHKDWGEIMDRLQDWL